MVTFWWRRWHRRKDRLSDDIVRSLVDVFFSDADMSLIEQSLANHVVSTHAAVRLAVGPELTERQCGRRCRYTDNSLTDDVVVAVVVVQWSLIVGRRLPRLARYWLADDVKSEML